MKRAVILHAMEQNSLGHWYPWLKAELEKCGYKVWVPDLPHFDHPDTVEMTEFLLSNTDWDFSDNVIIGHSSGAVEVLYLLQQLQETVAVNVAVSISAFDRMVPGMESQHDKMFIRPLDFAAIRHHAKKILFVHGADDPWCPVDGARRLAKETAAELVVLPTGKHFSTSLDPEYTKFPQLLTILQDRHLL